MRVLLWMNTWAAGRASAKLCRSSGREATERLDLGPFKVAAVPDGNAADPHQAAAANDSAVSDAGVIDVQILGIGRSGHIAFNEPGSALNSITRVEVLTERTRRANARYFRSQMKCRSSASPRGWGQSSRRGTCCRVAGFSPSRGRYSSGSPLRSRPVNRRWQKPEGPLLAEPGRGRRSEAHWSHMGKQGW